MKTRVLFGLLLAAFLLSGFISPGIAAAPPPDESGGKFILHPEEGKLADVVAEIVVQGASVQKALPQGNLLVEAPEGIGETSLSRLPGVSWAEPDIPFYAQTTPNDPDYARQWYLERINMPQAWDTASGGNPSVEIAV